MVNQEPTGEVDKLGMPLFDNCSIDQGAKSSPTLFENPATILHPQIEVTEYFKRQDPEYLGNLNRLAKQIPEAVDPKLDTVVCIPVAGHQESANIYETIRSFAHQSYDPAKFELLLFVNSSESKSKEQSVAIQRTLQEIRRAKKDFVKLNLRVVKAAIPDDQVKIGNIRKILNDVALIRYQESKSSRDLLLVSNDADNEGLSPTYLKEYADYFASHPDKEGAVGNLQFDPNGFIRFPELGLRTEFVTLLDQRGFNNGNVTLFGGNSVMKASIYAAIGGYEASLKTGEQEWTGDTIRRFRKTKATLGYVPGALLVTSIRRGVLSYINDPYKQIAFGNEVMEEKMRSLDVNSFPVFNFDDPIQIGKLQAALNERINHIIKLYEDGDRLGKDSWFYRKHLEMLGIRYQVEGDPKDPQSRVKITSIRGFIERVRKMSQIIQSGESNMSKVFIQTPYYQAQ